MKKLTMLLLPMLIGFGGCVKKQDAKTTLVFPGEKHFTNVHQLTFKVRNAAEAYLSFNQDMLTFQAERDSFKCDQIFAMNLDGSDKRLISTGKGRTTCSYFLPGDDRILFSSTHLAGEDCPPPPDMSHGYVWSLYPSYDIFTINIDGSDLQQLTDTPGYDAEATISPDGKKIVFTSLRNGDLDIYTMDLDGKNVQQLTDDLGYDGGPFYSPDNKRIVYRAFHPETEDEKQEYKELLAQNLIRPTRLDIWVMNADGSNKTRVTNNGVASFAPYFHPDGKRIIFASNYGSENARNFELWMVNDDGTGLEQITHFAEFDGFPMFTKDGKKLVFASNRNAASPGQTNIFVADWQD